MAADRELHKRIAALNRAALENVPPADPEIEAIRRKIRQPRSARRPAAPDSAIIYRRDLPNGSPPPSRPRPSSADPLSLDSAVPGSEVVHDSSGPAYVCIHCACDLGDRASRVVTGLPTVLAQPESDLVGRMMDLCSVERLTPPDLAFLDLETCGLSSAPLFLGGLLLWEEDGLVVRQYLARDYSEEAAVTALVAETLNRTQLLVTFNGKTFDVPFLRMRAAANGVAFGREPAHLDMLHECRRAWRHRLPDCKLQTLERYVCGWYRTGDIPGAEVPDAYHEFVRTGDAADLARIMHHNRLDLLTLAELFVRLAESESE